VVGFFQDGADAQMPVIIGTLPGIPDELATKVEKGDDDKYPGKGFQDYKNANYPKYKETDVNRLAVNSKIASGPHSDVEDNPHSSLTIRRADRDLAVGTAQVDGVPGGVAIIPEDLDTDNGGKWDEPTTPYDATYPYNHVYESEGGHIREMDDTPSKERIHERHSSGSGYEIHPDGSKVTRVKKDNYTIVSNDDYAHIQGTSRTTIDEGVRVRVNADGIEGNNYNIEVGQGSNVNVEVNGGNINLTTLGTGQDAGDININAKRSLNIQVEKDVNIGVGGKWTEVVTYNKKEECKVHEMNAEEQDINGNVINLN
jgi:hypothetical protein